MGEIRSDDYYEGVKDAAYLLATWGMDDQSKHFARGILRHLLTESFLITVLHDLDCEGCGWSGQQSEDILPNQSIYCPKCRRAVWPPKYKFHKGDESWRS